MNRCRALLCAAFLFVLASCSLYPTNQSPTNYPRLSDQKGKFQVQIEKDFFVIQNSIKAELLIGGSSYEMKRIRGNIFQRLHDVKCKGQIDYKIRATGRFIAIPLPIVLPTKPAFDPDVGTATQTIGASGNLDFPPVVVLPPSDRSLFFLCDTQALAAGTCTNKDLPIENSDPRPLEILVANTGACQGNICNGESSGDVFSVDPSFALPQTASCGATLNIPIVFTPTFDRNVFSGSLVIFFRHVGEQSTQNFTVLLEGQWLPF